jgi:hypothetical protein
VPIKVNDPRGWLVGHIHLPNARGISSTEMPTLRWAFRRKVVEIGISRISASALEGNRGNPAVFGARNQPQKFTRRLPTALSTTSRCRFAHSAPIFARSGLACAIFFSCGAVSRGEAALLLTSLPCFLSPSTRLLLPERAHFAPFPGRSVFFARFSTSERPVA